MIRTFSLNPAVDVSVVVPELIPVHKIRASAATREAGGGGVNVARLLQRFGAEVECVLAIGGASGAEVYEALDSLDITVSVLPVVGATRESIQIHDTAADLRYRVTLDGPQLVGTPAEIAHDMRTGRVPDVNVFSGSLPPGSPPSTYAELSSVHPSAFTIVDTSGPALAASVSGSVDLIKPSLRELESLAGRDISDAAELAKALTAVLDDHEQLGSVLTSLGGAGAVLGQRGEPILRFEAPNAQVVSAVGAGDAMVAGVAWGMSRGDDVVTACRLGVAAGTATVATPGSALCTTISALNVLGGVGVSELGPSNRIR
jgi:6-phosphofructokinase 2